MKFETVKTLKTEAFRRLTGVKREIFDHMTSILKLETQVLKSLK